jgi:hypothetical protein
MGMEKERDEIQMKMIGEMRIGREWTSFAWSEALKLAMIKRRMRQGQPG